MNPLKELFTTSDLGSLNFIIFSFFIGACLAGVATVYHRRTIGALVRYLLEHDAHSPETGKTLKEAEQDLNIFVILSVTKNAAFRRIVTMADDPFTEIAGRVVAGPRKKSKIVDIPLYIAPAAKRRAEMMYAEKTSEDANMWMVLLSIAVFAVVAYASAYIVPKLISMFEGLF